MKIRRRRVKLSITLRKPLFDALEKARGPIPLSRFIEALLEDALRARKPKPAEDKREAGQE